MNIPDSSQAMVPIESMHTVLYCQKWQECVSFYRDTLGFPVALENQVFSELQSGPGSFIGLINARRSKRRTSCTHDNYLLSFRVSDVELLHEVLQKKWKGVAALKDHPWGARLFELHDPEGRRLEFWSNVG